MTENEQIVAFKQMIQEGHKVEARDWMPKEYRQLVIKFIERHALSELMGALPERSWILRAPSLHRKLAVTSKVQDEVGHAQLLFRLLEDLGRSREAIMADLFSGKSKFHNVFHYQMPTWADMGLFVWWVDAASLFAQSGLRRASYAPYARTMIKVCWEEAFHLKHGEDIVLTLAMGTPQQRAMLQEAANRWWEPVMMFFGPPTPAEQDDAIQWGLKEKSNEELRQAWLNRYVKQILELGIAIADPKLRYNEETKLWEYTQPDWKKLYSVVTGHGPASQQRLSFRQLSYAESEWVRQAILGGSAVVA
jgi:ring-1,2-phenylacetyl-CoA epoxidase subunit PaaA